MLLGVSDAAGGRGVHARIMPPERWQKMASARKQKAIRVALLNKIASVMNIPQSTLREKYLGTLSMIIEHDPLDYARELGLDADQLNYFLNDKAKTQELMKILQLEEKAKEKERDTGKKKLKKEKSSKEDTEPQPGPVAQPQPEPQAQQKPPEPEPISPPAKKSPPPTQSSFDMF
jgi:replication factor C large subunit